MELLYTRLVFMAFGKLPKTFLKKERTLMRKIRYNCHKRPLPPYINVYAHIDVSFSTTCDSHEKEGRTPLHLAVSQYDVERYRYCIEDEIVIALREAHDRLSARSRYVNASSCDSGDQLQTFIATNTMVSVAEGSLSLETRRKRSVVDEDMYQDNVFKCSRSTVTSDEVQLVINGHANGHAEAVRVLLEHGADVEAIDEVQSSHIQHSPYPTLHG
jgi:hypothetical protein